MKKSGIFWLVVVLGILYTAFNYHWIALAVVYGVWYILGIVIHYSFKSINIVDYNDDFDREEILDLFQTAPYLFTLAHIFLIGMIAGIYTFIANSGRVLRNFNEKMDDFEVKLPKKEKKKSFSEYKKENF